MFLPLSAFVENSFAGPEGAGCQQKLKARTEEPWTGGAANMRWEWSDGEGARRRAFDLDVLLANHDVVAVHPSADLAAIMAVAEEVGVGLAAELDSELRVCTCRD